jgi:hypothetical protein
MKRFLFGLFVPTMVLVSGQAMATSSVASVAGFYSDPTDQSDKWEKLNWADVGDKISKDAVYRGDGIGEQGIQGIQGETGEQGIQGETGLGYSPEQLAQTNADHEILHTNDTTGQTGNGTSATVGLIQHVQNIDNRVTGLSNTVTNHEGRISALENEVNSQQQQIDNLKKDDKRQQAGIALAVAMSQHQFNPSSPDAQVSLAGGGYFQDGNSAGGFSLAFGAPIIPGEVFANGAVGVTTQGDPAVGAAVTFILK